MSIMMMFEADSHISEADVRLALSRCGVDRLVEREGGFSGNFPSSNMFFSYQHAADGEGAIKVEGATDFNWEVGCRLMFTYVTASYTECSSQLHCFAEMISEVSDGSWVLSFQYEVICAKKDDNGFIVLKDF
ncbi:hypothetical protein RA280_21400 [Cupriavidus sp. CV2]|uniref:hypothetical protein n=1 Tax=Cupriavidus ulmosensis TaxID=3065913 RepID=UPI00296AADDF|nr:hypothetical protein [Cupriavidus sp. CV2]MDW3684261.1 hypothetical protein [Cupriavidus sp. CV2]